MKKNDFATFIVYVAMFAVALLVGLLAIKPTIDSYGYAITTVHPALILVFGLLVGGLFNAAGLELCHLLGAKMGKYRVYKLTVLGVSFSNKKVRLSGFDGLTGETKIAPLDPKESSLSAYVFLPVLFLFIEFIGCMVGIVLCQSNEAANPSIAWLHIFLITILTVGGMIFLYDLFPAHIESVTDGFLITLLSKPANKEAYNHYLLAQEAEFKGEPILELPIYSELTDFTAGFNLIAAYRLLAEDKAEEALAIINPIVAAEGLSNAMKHHATALKLAVLLEKEDRTQGKKFYEELDDGTKKYIADVSSLTALRCYLLIATFVEDTEYEANYAIGKAERSIKSCEPEYKDTEKSLLQLDVDLCRAAKPKWNLDSLPWEEKPEEPEPEQEKPAEDEPEEPSKEEKPE